MIIIVCTILSEKVTCGPSGPLAIINFFQKKSGHTNNPQVRAEKSPYKGL